MELPNEREALEVLFQRVSAEPVKVLLDEHDRQVILVNAGTGQAKTMDVRKNVFTRNHQFMSLESLIGYLNSSHCGEQLGKAIVAFVGDLAVQVDLGYGDAGTPHRAWMKLEEAEEFVALKKLMQGVGQRELWRLLTTDLDGAIDRELLIAISQIRVRAKDEAEVGIAATGLMNRKAEGGVAVSYADAKGNGVNTVEIRTKWTWTGRIWECFEEKSTIELTMEVDADGGGLKFIFWPSRFDAAIQRARQAMIEKIGKETPEHVSVYDGKLA